MTSLMEFLPMFPFILPKPMQSRLQLRDLHWFRHHCRALLESQFLFTKGNSTSPFVKVCRSSRHCGATFAVLNPKVLDIELWTKVSQEKKSSIHLYLTSAIVHKGSSDPTTMREDWRLTEVNWRRSWRRSKWDVKTRKSERVKRLIGGATLLSSRFSKQPPTNKSSRESCKWHLQKKQVVHK